MAYLDEWQPEEWIELTPRQEEFSKASLAKHFWKWYEEHKDEAIVKILFWSVFYYRDLYHVFVKLFGEPRT